MLGTVSNIYVKKDIRIAYTGWAVNNAPKHFEHRLELCINANGEHLRKKRHSNSIHIVLRLSAISLIGCIGVPAKKILGNEILPKFCDVCPNHNFLAHYG